MGGDAPPVLGTGTGHLRGAAGPRGEASKANNTLSLKDGIMRRVLWIAPREPAIMASTTEARPNDRHPVP